MFHHLHSFPPEIKREKQSEISIPLCSNNPLLSLTEEPLQTPLHIYFTSQSALSIHPSPSSIFLSLKFSSIIPSLSLSPSLSPEMDSSFSCHNLTCGHKLHHLTFSFFILLISSLTQPRFTAEGRAMPPKPIDHSLEEKMILRGQIGSRPPRCERRCSSCERCEAIQVPTNPQIKAAGSRNSSSMAEIEYARGDDTSNYKPMSWKCKCGNFIFNP